MTALGGFLSFDGSPCEPRCAAILRGQARYGRTPQVTACNGLVALGRTLFPTLPEDRFDQGPVRKPRLLLVGDLRIDNRDEIAALAGMSSADLRGSSDSMLAAALIERREAESLAAIVGEYALAWWDERDQALHLARDVLARRPLIYHRNATGIAFASMPSGLHALGDVPEAFDPDWLAADLAQLPHRGRETPYKDIDRVLPGEVLTIDRERLSSEWLGALRVAIDHSLRGHKAQEVLRQVVEQAVRDQLRGADGRVATHLSAGLDSAIVTTTAARALGSGRVTAFTAAPGVSFAADVQSEWITDESGLAAQVAETRDDIDHVIVRNEGESPLTGMANDYHFQQQPTQNLANGVWGRAILRQAHARKLGVLLSGGGGNFTVTYAGVEALPEMLARGSLLDVAKGLRALRRSGRTWPSSLAAAAFPLLPGTAWQAASRWWRRPRDLTEYAPLVPRIAAAMEGRAAELNWRLDYPPRRDPVGTRVEGLTRTDGANFYKGVLAEWGVSIREPLLDLRVIKLCLAIPPEEYLTGGRPRDLARRAFEDRLPAALVAEHGRGLQAADWAEGAKGAADAIREELAFARRTPLLIDILDIDQLELDLAALEQIDPVFASNDLHFEVRLLRGLAATYFARRTAGTN